MYGQQPYQPTPDQIAEMKRREMASIRLKCLEIAATSRAAEAGLPIVEVAQEYVDWIMAPDGR